MSTDTDSVRLVFLGDNAFAAATAACVADDQDTVITEVATADPTEGSMKATLGKSLKGSNRATGTNTVLIVNGDLIHTADDASGLWKLAQSGYPAIILSPQPVRDYHGHELAPLDAGPGNRQPRLLVTPATVNDLFEAISGLPGAPFVFPAAAGDTPVGAGPADPEPAPAAPVRPEPVEAPAGAPSWAQGPAGPEPAPAAPVRPEPVEAPAGAPSWAQGPADPEAPAAGAPVRPEPVEAPAEAPSWAQGPAGPEPAPAAPVRPEPVEAPAEAPSWAQGPADPEAPAPAAPVRPEPVEAPAGAPSFVWPNEGTSGVPSPTRPAPVQPPAWATGEGDLVPAGNGSSGTHAGSSAVPAWATGGPLKTISTGLAVVREPLAPDDGRVIAVCSKKGGTGKSTSTLNLAAALATKLAPLDKKVVLLDANTEQADASRYLGLSERVQTIEQLIQEPVLDKESVGRALTDLTGDVGFHALFGAVDARKKSTTAITAELYRRIVTVLRSMFDYIVIDTPVAEPHRPLFRDFVLEEADAIVAVVAPSEVTIQNNMEWLAGISDPVLSNGRLFPSHRVGVMLNMAREDGEWATPNVMRVMSEWQFLGAIPQDERIHTAGNRKDLYWRDPQFEREMSRILFEITRLLDPEQAGEPSLDPGPEDRRRGGLLARLRR